MRNGLRVMKTIVARWHLCSLASHIASWNCQTVQQSSQAADTEAAALGLAASFMRKELGSVRAVHIVGSPKQVATMAMQIKSLEASLAAATAAEATCRIDSEAFSAAREAHRQQCSAAGMRAMSFVIGRQQAKAVAGSLGCWRRSMAEEAASRVASEAMVHTGMELQRMSGVRMLCMIARVWQLAALVDQVRYWRCSAAVNNAAAAEKAAIRKADKAQEDARQVVALIRGIANRSLLSAVQRALVVSWRCSMQVEQVQEVAQDEIGLLRRELDCGYASQMGFRIGALRSISGMIGQLYSTALVVLVANWKCSVAVASAEKAANRLRARFVSVQREEVKEHRQQCSAAGMRAMSFVIGRQQAKAVAGSLGCWRRSMAEEAASRVASEAMVHTGMELQRMSGVRMLCMIARVWQLAALVDQVRYWRCSAAVNNAAAAEKAAIRKADKAHEDFQQVVALIRGIANRSLLSAVHSTALIVVVGNWKCSVAVARAEETASRLWADVGALQQKELKVVTGIRSMPRIIARREISAQAARLASWKCSMVVEKAIQCTMEAVKADEDTSEQAAYEPHHHPVAEAAGFRILNSVLNHRKGVQLMQHVARWQMNMMSSQFQNLQSQGGAAALCSVATSENGQSTAMRAQISSWRSSMGSIGETASRELSQALEASVNAHAESILTMQNEIEGLRGELASSIAAEDTIADFNARMAAAMEAAIIVRKQMGVKIVRFIGRCAIVAFTTRCIACWKSHSNQEVTYVERLEESSYDIGRSGISMALHDHEVAVLKTKLIAAIQAQTDLEDQHAEELCTARQELQMCAECGGTLTRGVEVSQLDEDASGLASKLLVQHIKYLSTSGVPAQNTIIALYQWKYSAMSAQISNLKCLHKAAQAQEEATRQASKALAAAAANQRKELELVQQEIQVLRDKVNRTSQLEVEEMKSRFCTAVRSAGKMRKRMGLKILRIVSQPLTVVWLVRSVAKWHENLRLDGTADTKVHLQSSQEQSLLPEASNELVQEAAAAQHTAAQGAALKQQTDASTAKERASRLAADEDAVTVESQELSKALENQIHKLQDALQAEVSERATERQHYEDSITLMRSELNKHESSVTAAAADHVQSSSADHTGMSIATMQLLLETEIERRSSQEEHHGVILQEMRAREEAKALIFDQALAQVKENAEDKTQIIDEAIGRTVSLLKLQAILSSSFKTTVGIGFMHWKFGASHSNAKTHMNGFLHKLHLLHVASSEENQRKEAVLGDGLEACVNMLDSEQEQ